MEQIKNKKIVTVILAAILALGAVGATFALLNTRSETATNLFNGAGVNIGIVEDGEEKPIESGSKQYPEIQPGTPMQKEVQIKNIDSKEYPTTDTYVRVRLVPIFRDKNGGSVAADLSQVQYTYGNEDGTWKKEVREGETYYYYTESLASNELTSKLITAVQYNAEIPEGTTFELQVLTEGIASGQEGALSAWGLQDFSALLELK